MALKPVKAQLTQTLMSEPVNRENSRSLEQEKTVELSVSLANESLLSAIKQESCI